MQRFRIQREICNDKITLGRMFDPDQDTPFRWHTLENPFCDNQRSVSCIPAGSYWCEPYNSPTFGHTWIVLNVPNRSYILFHAGNYVEHTQGCIILGMSRAKNERAVWRSRDAVAQFMNYLNTRDVHKFLLEIRDCA